MGQQGHRLQRDLRLVQVELNILVREDTELGIYVSWCPALRIFSQGTSREEAIESIRDTVNQYLSASEELDRQEASGRGMVYETVDA